MITPRYYIPAMLFVAITAANCSFANAQYSNLGGPSGQVRFKKLSPKQLQVIDFGSLDWKPIKTFGFRDWNNVRYKAQVVNGKFQTIKHGTTKWTPQQFIRVKKLDPKSNTYRDAIVEVLKGKKFQYMYNGTTTWIPTRHLEFKRWSLENGQDKDRRSTIEMLE